MAADITIGYLHGATVEATFHDSLMAILSRDRFRRIDGVISVEVGPVLVWGRNILAREFLANRQAKWLLMVDSDMELPLDIVPRLLRHATPQRVVGALCFAYEPRSRTATPTLYGEGMATIRSWEPGALVPVKATGAACLMIHRNVLEKTPAPWFVTDPIGRFGEDQGFCLNIAKAGFKLAVDTSTVVGHTKRLIVDDRDYVQSGLSGTL